jgi:5-formyltetrahydrofolate cyclo-ligase
MSSTRATSRDSADRSKRNMTTKQELRKRLKSILRKKFESSPAEEILRQSESTSRNLLQLSPVSSAGTIMLYIEMPWEFPVTAFFQTLLAQKPRILLIPWCDDDTLRPFPLISSDELAASKKTIHELLDERLAPGAFGILEPKKELRRHFDFQFDPHRIDLLILPGLGFDPLCHRLGRGKGFYDRFSRQLRKDVPLIGVGFDEQIVEIVPTEPHDRALDHVITPTRIFTHPPRQSR